MTSNKSNIINLFSDDNPSARESAWNSGKNGLQGISFNSMEKKSPNTAHQTYMFTLPAGVSTVPQSNEEGESMAEIEKRLYSHPAVAQATAFRYKSGNNQTGFGAAIVVFDWIEKVTTADITKWITKHLDQNNLPFKIVCLETDLLDP